MKLFLIVLFLFSPLLVHELGHVAFIKGFGGKVKGFVFGVWLKVFSYKKFQLNLIPISAYVVPDENNKLSSKQMLLVESGGILANAIYALILYCIYLNGGNQGYLLMVYINLAIIGMNAIPLANFDGLKMLVRVFELFDKQLSEKTIKYVQYFTLFIIFCCLVVSVFDGFNGFNGFTRTA